MKRIHITPLTEVYAADTHGIDEWNAKPVVVLTGSGHWAYSDRRGAVEPLDRPMSHQKHALPVVGLFGSGYTQTQLDQLPEVARAAWLAIQRKKLTEIPAPYRLSVRVTRKILEPWATYQPKQQAHLEAANQRLRERQERNAEHARAKEAVRSMVCADLMPKDGEWRAGVQGVSLTWPELEHMLTVVRAAG